MVVMRQGFAFQWVWGLDLSFQACSPITSCNFYKPSKLSFFTCERNTLLWPASWDSGQD